MNRPPSTQDIDEYTEVQRVLREEIVNPLRKNWFVRADRVMKLRQLLDSLTSVRGLMSEEKGTVALTNINVAPEPTFLRVEPSFLTREPSLAELLHSKKRT